MAKGIRQNISHRMTLSHPMTMFIVALFSFLSIIISCNSRNEPATSLNKNLSALTSDSVFSKSTVQYAKGFEITYYDNYKEIKVYNPWQKANNVQYKYILVDKNVQVPESLSTDAQIIETPVKRIVCLSTTHIAFIDFINETNSIVGVAGTKFTNNKNVRKLINQGEIADVGYDKNLNYELLISLKPDIVMTYGVGSETANYINKLNELGIKVIINAEYLEQTPLAKAEWLKFVAAFYNKEKIANKQFSLIENEYNSLKSRLQSIDSIKPKPTVLTNTPMNDIWYVPGGNSYVAKLIKDAGGKYMWDNNKSRESIALSIEAVFEKAHDADDWLYPGSANNLQEIVAVDERRKYFKAYNNNNIFNNNAIQNEFGSNDYWESGLINPHIILKDLIYIFHPEVLSEHKLIYYKKL